MTHIQQHGFRVAFFLVIIFSSIYANGNNRLTRREKKQVSRLLDSVCVEDQLYRIPILYGTLDRVKIDSMKQLSREEKMIVFRNSARNRDLEVFRDSLFNLMDQADKKNYQFVKEIISDYGYPSFYKDSDNVLLIIEHSIVYDRNYLDTLRQFVEAKKISPWDYAKIYDRYLMLNGDKLMYFTRGKYNSIQSKEECLKANVAREELGVKDMLNCKCYND